jgi:hypothetical protein
VTRPEIVKGLKQCLEGLRKQALEVKNQRDWSLAEKLVVGLSIKHEYEAVYHAIKELSDASEAERPSQEVRRSSQTNV